MKILHTADWHLGKVLHKQDLYPDLCLFFDWLIDYIKQEAIDLLLVSGDIFDLANPSNRDTKLYYDVLSRLALTQIKVIITGGNHDSISLLNSPSEVLKPLNISVIGGITEKIDDEIIPVYDLINKLQCIVLAVPFLRDRDLRSSIQADQDIDKSEIISIAISSHYDTLISLTQQKYGDNIPIIAMGHLYMKGSITSDSEREIHIGNLQGYDSRLINPSIKYMALGHIHKAQKVGGHNHIRYSGSPIFLDFSERDYDKMVIQIELNNLSITEIKSIHLPVNRKIVKYSGSFEELKSKIRDFKNPYSLDAFIELNILENKIDHQLIKDRESIVEENPNENFKILINKISFHENLKNSVFDVLENDTINEMTPFQIFQKRIDKEGLGDEVRQELNEIFIELVQELND